LSRKVEPGQGGKLLHQQDIILGDGGRGLRIGIVGRREGAGDGKWQRRHSCQIEAMTFYAQAWRGHKQAA